MQYLDAEPTEENDVILQPEEFSASAFTPEEKEVFEKALVLGKNEKKIDVLGHSVTIRTLSIRDDLQVSSIIKPFEGSRGLKRAFMAATVAASLVDIDDEPFYVPISSSDHDNMVFRKFEKLQDYYSLFVDAVYEEIINLASDTEKSVIQKLGKSSG